jgi:hypothetical protein
MDLNDLHVTLSDLTELDRLELEELLGEKVETTPRPAPRGHLGEPGTWTVIIELSKVAIPTIGTCLAIFLGKGRHRVDVADNIEVSNSKGTFRRKLQISIDDEQAVKANVIKELDQAAHEFVREIHGAGSA